jgi:hypothetical protein
MNKPKLEQTKFTKWMTTPLASFVKVFVASMLTQYLIELQDGHQLFSWDLAMIQKICTAGVVANLPVVINFLNPSYTHYGKK